MHPVTILTLVFLGWLLAGALLPRVQPLTCARYPVLTETCPRSEPRQGVPPPQSLF